MAALTAFPEQPEPKWAWQKSVQKLFAKLVRVNKEREARDFSSIHILAKK
ncbi:MAG: hypothetical protein OK422_05130 [Thaumarchaeota archaeon]|nr:hypothetical protein [Nitrososphaerota archaeon]